MSGKQLFDDWPERYDRWFETPVGKAVLHALRARLDDGDSHQAPRTAPPIMPHIDSLSVLKRLDL